MIDEKELESIRDDLSRLSNDKIEQTKASRDVVKKSKELIYSIHRGDMETAKDKAAEIEEMRKKLDEMAKTEKLRGQHSYSIAVQEYVEAVTYHEVMTSKRLPTRKQLNADTELYLMGLSDLTGELVRKAVDDMVKENYDRATWLRDVVSEIYGAILSLDFEGGEARRKSDQIKWNLNKLEDLVYDAKIRGKI
ncbi:MAG: hypothetical protein GF416_06030 [Candidatus Altiarchaeales archaeon]|nr:hypothetical protein [Candidatus Altiarchaeales archaeon]MBD3416674.1 hypothetical protein [Candidatus Altiarchaeales archaeon]